jgi:hypothetical protein
MRAENTPWQTATNTPLPTPTFTVDPIDVVIPPDPCIHFEGKDMSMVIYDIHKGDSSFTMYVKVPGGVYAADWEDEKELAFSATMGELESLECKVLDSDQYADRLHCFFPFTMAYKNTAQPFFLFMETCLEPIFSHPEVSLMVEGADKPTKEPAAGCGPEPAACGAEYDAWCACDGGLFYGCVVCLGCTEGEPACFYP